MVTIKGQDGIFTINIAGGKEGDIVTISDMVNNKRKIQLGIQMGDDFGFTWVEEKTTDNTSKTTQNTPTNGANAHLKKVGDNWRIKTTEEQKEGDKVKIFLSKTNELVEFHLGKYLGDNLFVNAQDETEGKFVKIDKKWYIRTNEQHQPGDKVRIYSQKGGLQDKILGDKFDTQENTFETPRGNHFIPNPVCDEPKWCVRVYDEVKIGDVVEVNKSGAPPQKHKLLAKVDEEKNIWITKKQKE